MCPLSSNNNYCDIYLDPAKCSSVRSLVWLLCVNLFGIRSPHAHAAARNYTHVCTLPSTTVQCALSSQTVHWLQGSEVHCCTHCICTCLHCNGCQLHTEFRTIVIYFLYLLLYFQLQCNFHSIKFCCHSPNLHSGLISLNECDALELHASLHFCAIF